MRQGKKWGYTTKIFSSASNSMHHLEINRDGFCSEHRHEHKYNLFYVISGVLELTIWHGKTRDVTLVAAGQTTEVPPGVWHKFKGTTPVECIEVYRALLVGEDIERRTEGGRK